MPHNATAAVREHYNLASGHYHTLWGEHIHHGYWITGKESKEEAAENLIELLVEKAGITAGARVLDVGCGVGGSSRWLARNLGCRVSGVTISPVQVEMAQRLTAEAGIQPEPEFRVDDANALSVEGPFDFIWSVEMISHLSDRAEFFRRCAALLAPGGRMAITDWWKAEGLSGADTARYIEPLEAGMLVDLPTLSEYTAHIAAAGLRLAWYEDISRRVSKTWELSMNLVSKPAVWGFALRNGRALVDFLQSFQAMRAGFRSGTFIYPALVLEKPA